jgi:transcriptional regulator with XRE-family HTH domain
MLRKMNTLAERIHHIRSTQGLTMQELADKLGITKNAISKLENGKSLNLKLDNLYRLQDITGYSAEWIAIGRGSQMATKSQSHVDISALSEESKALILRLIKKI